MPDKFNESIHTTVLLDETVGYFVGLRSGWVIDATLGMGGHSNKLLTENTAINVLGIDQDTAAIKIAGERLAGFGDRFKSVHGNFVEIADLIAANGVANVTGIYADLGVSSLQFDSPERGFSFRFDAPLDMRMDSESDEPTAADILATYKEEDIANLIYQYGEERASRKIARRIVERRERGEPVTTTKQLADLVYGALKKGGKDKIHPATRTFQALRIAVNRELEILENFLWDSIRLLDEDGVLAIITFHSLEDRIVKQTFQKASGRCFCPPRMPQCMCGAKKLVEILTKKPIVPGEEELNTNQRSRSAKLRVVKKLEQKV